jgi:hypothetical protein
MRELDFRESLEKLMPEDKPEFDNFSWQFVASLTDNPPSYWHGRLIGFSYDEASGKWNECSIEFFDEVYSELEWRRKLEDGEIVINKFVLNNDPDYTPAAASVNHINPHTVRCSAYIEATVDGEPKSGNVDIIHNIRRTYLSHKTVIKQAT